jgi:hypothetical protein
MIGWIANMIGTLIIVHAAYSVHAERLLIDATGETQSIPLDVMLLLPWCF